MATTDLLMNATLIDVAANVTQVIVSNLTAIIADNLTSTAPISFVNVSTSANNTAITDNGSIV